MQTAHPTTYKDTPAAIKMRAVRAIPEHRKIIEAKANINRLSKIVAYHEVMRRRFPGLTQTQQAKTAGICYRALLVQVVLLKYNFLNRKQATPNV